ncbi:MAG: histidine kinase dimerization/phospho-acceptor domain-containing protein [Thermodesulfobacteriota bacterium]
MKKKEAEFLTITIRNSLRNHMLRGDIQDFDTYLSLLGIQEGLPEVRIVSEAGLILRSPSKFAEKSFLPKCPSVKSIPWNKPLIFPEEVQGRLLLRAFHLLPNEMPCFSCHGQDKKILGILNVDLPLDTTQRAISFHRHLLITSMGITLLLMAMAINLLLNRLVKKPIEQLIQAMSRVEKGDFHAEINLSSKDELGILAKSFRSMVEKLSLAQKELERQHQQQMRQVKYLASIGELAASVAHEIKNPLAGIKLAIQVLAKQPDLATKHRETIQDIMQSIERLDRTMGDLLSYSRIQPPQLKTVNLHEVIEHALTGIKEQCHLSGINIQGDFDPAMPLISLDPLQIERGLLNIFLNACQAMPDGGVITIRTKWHPSGYQLQHDLPYLEGFPPEKGWVEVSIWDTGVGIPPEIKGDIFRPFFTTKAKGTGLGLSLAQRIFEQHNYSLWQP